ncbi:MAG: histidinol-phosphatase [Ruminococcus sp.]|nr:histidinol-phosphatase [Ruminococcus sp.]
MQNFDLHIHSTYSDGKDSLEDIVLAAIGMGLSKIGFSDHSYTPFDESYCISIEDIPRYIDEISVLKEKYKDKITILSGIEQDFFSTENTDKFDYVIGSVHYIKVDDGFVPVDETKEILLKASEQYFQGDIYKLIDSYYDTVADVVDKTNADIIGHIDLITKFNENGILFNEGNCRYIKAYQKACDKLLASNKVFEINTGAISRGYKKSPYPSSDIYEYLKSKGAKFILSSDSHSTDTICYNFDKYSNLV